MSVVQVFEKYGTYPTMVICLLYLISIACLLRALRQDHEETWVELGRPSLILGNSISSGMAVVRFLFFGEYKVLRSQRVRRFAAASRGLLLFAVVVFLTELTLFFSLR